MTAETELMDDITDLLVKTLPEFPQAKCVSVALELMPLFRGRIVTGAWLDKVNNEISDLEEAVSTLRRLTTLEA